MSVAVAVQKDNADVGMGIYSCARALGLDFIDVTFEEYDFVTYASYLELPFGSGIPEDFKERCL